MFKRVNSNISSSWKKEGCKYTNGTPDHIRYESQRVIVLASASIS
jgi:hypothetical protein